MYGHTVNLFPDHAMKKCEVVEAKLQKFVTLALNIGEWSASCLAFALGTLSLQPTK
jgi:hypothetical protein